MFKYTWPFPDYEIIAERFSEHFIDDNIYNYAKAFYLSSLKAEEEKLNDFIRGVDQEEERLFIHNLVQQAIYVAIGHAKPRK